MKLESETYLVLGISVRALVETALKEGIPVVGSDSFGDFDLVSSVPYHPIPPDYYRRNSLIQDLARRFPTAKSLIYTSSLENHPEFLERLGGSFRIVGNGPETLRRVRDWNDLQAFCRRNRIGFPKTVFRQENPQIFNKRQPPVVKPIRTGGGWRNRILKEGEEVDFRHEFLQDYVPGRSFSCSFVGDGSRAWILGVSHQLIGKREFGSNGFQYCGNIYPAVLPRRVRIQLEGMAARLTREYGLVGLNGFDFILNSGKPVLVEVNPRFTASMELISRRGDFPDLITLHIRSSLGRRFTVRRKRKKGGFYGKAVCYATQDTVLTNGERFFKRGVRDITPHGKVIQTSKPLFSIFSTGSSPNSCYRNLVRTSAEMYREIRNTPLNETAHGIRKTNR